MTQTISAPKHAEEIIVQDVDTLKIPEGFSIDTILFSNDFDLAYHHALLDMDELKFVCMVQLSLGQLYWTAALT